MLDIQYRPKSWSEVIGNDGPVKVFKARCAKGTLKNRSYMLGGPKGCGKTTIARILARSILCASPVDGGPCNACESCQSALDERHECLQEFDAASQGSVEKIRSIMDELDYSHVGGLPTIIILDEAHRLGPAAQDAMLKAMEERRFIAVLCTTEPSKIRPALRDRVDEFNIKPASDESLVARLRHVCEQESIPVDMIGLIELAQSCGGSPRVALNCLEYIHRDSGGVSAAEVRKYFKTDLLSEISHALMSFPTNPKYAMELIDPIMATESAAWARNAISELVVNSWRKKNGLPCKHASIANLYNTASSYPWMDLVNHLSLIPKINVFDVESALYLFLEKSTRPAVIEPPAVEPKRLIVRPQVTKELPQVAPPTKSMKSVAIDGITFTSEERISPLHDRMDGTRGPTGPAMPEVPIEVKYDKTKIPISEQEFIRGLHSRFQK